MFSAAADDISGETVAIKLVTRVFEKAQLAKRALREITLLRHFNHENITGLIDVDAITPDFNEMLVTCCPNTILSSLNFRYSYLFMEVGDFISSNSDLHSCDQIWQADGRSV